MVENTSRLWTPKQTADYLGITLKALYLRVYRGSIPYIKMGNGSSQLRFDENEIKAFIDEHRVRPFNMEGKK